MSHLRFVPFAGLLALAALVSLAGCPAGPLPTPQPGGSANYSRSLGSGPDFSLPDGRIRVITWLEYEETALDAVFADGPPLRFQVESERIGNCRLMTYTPDPCSPTCDPSTACVDGACVPHPTRADHGDLTWTWPDGELTVEPNDLLGYYATGTATTGGDSAVSFEDTALVAPTVGAPDAASPWDNALANRGDNDGVLRWSNPIQDARIRLHMTDCVATHGGIAAAEVECEGPDTGELIVPDAFLDALEAGDWSHGECGSHTFERYHAAAPEGDSSIRLETVGPGGLYYFP